MTKKRQYAEQNFIHSVEVAISNAESLGQYEGILITMLSDLMQIQCLISDDADLLKFELPSSIFHTVQKVVSHQDVRLIEWLEADDEMSTLIFGNKAEQDKFIQLFQSLVYSGQRAYPAPDIYLGGVDPDAHFCNNILQFLNVTTLRVVSHSKMVFTSDAQLSKLYSGINKSSISGVWVGAIYMNSELDDFSSAPSFTHLDQPVRCYLVEYDNSILSWRFFWSKPGQYGEDANFITQMMKENPSNNGDRHFNDASEDEMYYSSTLTLSNTDWNDGKAFFYRQQFDSCAQAFMGSLTPIDLPNVPVEWMSIFQKNAP